MKSDDSLATPTPIPDDNFGRRRSYVRPTTVALSRYLLLDRCGSGSVGVVYRAYDPQLDRKVAIKLLRARRSSRRREAVLLREAQAMARLSHPNVIAVHDVGSYDERDLGVEAGATVANLEIPSHGVFIVMELLDGLDLHEWIGRERRSWQEIVAAFIAAGRGLAAAHAVDLVHRDFKPSNVCVGDDGRICVLDFGLARSLTTSEDGIESRPQIVGTPLYMSPEQHRGEPATTLSDQYSFGVALHEALAGRGPWSGSPDDVAARKLAGDWPEPPTGTADARVWAVVRRAMATDPAARFPSMPALLEALEDCIAPRRRRFAAVAVGTTLLAASILFSASQTQVADPCAGAEDRVAQVWNADARARIAARIEASEAGYAATTWAEVQRRLDAYTADWAAQHRDACEATQVRREQSAAVLDLRMACLDRRLEEVSVVVETLAEADVDVVEHAVVTVGALGWLHACSDRDQLRAQVQLPHDPKLRREVEHGYAQLSRSRVNEAAGRYDLAASLADAAREDALRLEHRPLRAAADLHRAAAYEGHGEFTHARKALIDAYAEAEAARDEPIAADAVLRLLWIVGAEQGHAQEGEIWLRLAEAAIERLGHDPLRAATLMHNRGGLRAAQGLHALALADYQQALEAQRLLLGDNDPAVARTHNHIANVLINLHRYDEAWVHSERSLASRVASLGAEHPLVAACYNNMAVVRVEQGRLEEAGQLVDRALMIVGDSNTRTEGISRVIAKNIDIALGRREQARVHLLRLLEFPSDRLPRWTSRDELSAQLAAVTRSQR